MRKVILAVCGAVLLLMITAALWGSWLMQRSLRETYEEVSKVTLPCLPGTSQVIERWSKAGYSVSCRSNEVMDGPWQAWEGGHIHIAGTYLKGKQHGTWLVYTDKGKQIYRTIKFDNGRELSDVVR